MHTQNDCFKQLQLHTRCPYISPSANPQRQEMDRQRFEAAHLKYACLKMAAQYPMAINISYIGVEADISNSLNKITPILFQCFESKYAGMFILNEVMSKIVRCVFEA